MNRPDKPGFFRSLFAGRVPARRPPLPLYIPVQTRGDGPLPKVEAIWNQVTERRLDPVMLLQELNRYLDKINPLPLPHEQRMRIGNILLAELGAAATNLFARFFQQGGGIPETREQREGISHAARAAEQLAISYKLLFREEWGGEPGADRAADERLLSVSLRILECLRLEQLLRAFRYQKLPQYAWRDANQLFFALRGGWDVSARLPLKVRFSIEDGSGPLDLFPAQASIEQVYLSLQLAGLLDVISWPIQLMYRASAYLRELKEAPPVIADRGDELAPGQAVIYRNRSTAPAFERSPEQLGESLLIDLTPLLRQAAEEQAALHASPDAAVGGGTLGAMPPRERSALLELLLQRLQPRRRLDPRQRAFGAQRARIYGGFDAVYRLFREITHEQAQENVVVKDAQRLDRPAEQPPATAEGLGGLSDSVWVVADEGPGGIQLRQQENDYSMPLFVGRLVAYNTGDAVNDSRLGYLVRMQRLGDDEVEVAIARLHGRVKVAVVEDLDALEHRTVPALLIQDRDGKLRLLCDNRYDFFTGERLAVVNDDHHYTAALGDAVLTKGDFTVFELHTAEPDR